MRNLIREIPWAMRRMLRRPGFFLLAATLLAVGMGAALIVASLYDQIVLSRLAVPRPDELVLIQRMAVAKGGAVAEPWGVFSRDECRTLRRGAATTVEVACYAADRTVIGWGGAAAGGERLPVQWVTANYFSMLGLSPAAGRLLSGRDEPGTAGGGERDVVLSYDAWQRRFGRDAGVVGRVIRVDGTPAVIVGVAPRSFNGLRGDVVPELYQAAGAVAPEYSLFKAAGRLRLDRGGAPATHSRDAAAPAGPAASASSGGIRQARAQAETVLRAAFASLLATRPPGQSYLIVDGQTMKASERLDVVSGARGDSDLRGDFSRIVLLAGGMVLLVLMILSFNLANLLAAHAADERRQNSLRRALGAPGGRLAAAWLVESLVLCATGALLGVALAEIFGPLVLATLPEVAPTAIHFEISERVALAAASIYALTAALIGALAAWEASRSDAAAVLRSGGPRGGGDSTGSLWRWTLVGAQVALSVVLLAGMGLLARSLDKLLALRTGMPLAQTLTFNVDLPHVGRPPAPVLEQLRQRLAALPGVRAASYSRIPVLTGSANWMVLAIEGYHPAAGEVMLVNAMPVGSDFFAALDIPVIRGTGAVGRAGGAVTQHAVVINRRFAERYFPGANPVGRRLSLDGRRDWAKPAADDREIVGVVADGALATPQEDLAPRFYPAVEEEQRGVAFYVRGAVLPAALANAVRATVRAQAPDAALGELRTLAGQRERVLVQERLLDRFSLILGLLAALIAGVGLYGVVNLAVARRMRDLVVRLALGARRRDIADFACRDAARAVGIGMVVGLAAAVPATMLLKSFLYGVEPGDPAALAAAAILLIGIAAAACGVPVRRALAADPSAVLRQE